MDKLINRLRESKNEQCYIGCFGNCRYCEIDAELEQAADAIEKLNKPTWISVKNEIPKEKEEVFVVCKNGKMFVAEHLSNTYCNDGWNVIGPLGSKRRIGNNRVTHWMPLPQPPKEEI